MEKELQPIGTLTVDGRKKLTVTGVRRMGIVNDTVLTCETSLGALVVKGTGLRIVRFSQEEGLLVAEGAIDGTAWSGAKKSVWKRLWR